MTFEVEDQNLVDRIFLKLKDYLTILKYEGVFSSYKFISHFSYKLSISKRTRYHFRNRLSQTNQEQKQQKKLNSPSDYALSSRLT